MSKRTLDPTQGFAPWVIFDGDNTLWHVEQLYDRARAQLVALLDRHGVDPNVADRYQRKRDLDLYERFGYSPKRFETSLIETVSAFLPATTAGRLAPAVHEIFESVFLSPAHMNADLPEALDRLACAYHLAIITAGDVEIQSRRLREFLYTDHFAAVKIVTEKSTKVFDDFCRSYLVDRSRSFVIGDSIRSDILPAVEVGLHAIWCNAPNWREHEIGQHILPPSVAVANSLHEAIDIIMEMSRRGLDAGVGDGARGR